MENAQTRRVSIPQTELTKEQEIQILRDLQHTLPTSSYLRGLFTDGLIATAKIMNHLGFPSLSRLAGVAHDLSAPEASAYSFAGR